MGDGLTDIPSYASDPLRQAAVWATNTRSGNPTVEMRCAAPYRRGLCGKLLGGAWIRGKTGVVLVTRLGFHDSTEYYKRISRNREMREQTWKDQGFIEEELVLLLVRGKWHRVPCGNEPATVRCPRHGAWPLDLHAVIQKVGLARATGQTQTYGSVPPE